LSFVAEEDRDLVSRIDERRAAGETVPEGYECRLVTKSGRKCWVSMHNTATTFWGRRATLGNVQDIGELKRMELELRELSARLLKVQEDERRRVARDLHDGICQTLTATRLAIESHLGDAPMPALERRASVLRLRESVTAMREAVDEVRRISTDLRPAMLDDLGLLATLRWYLGELAQRHPDLEIRQHLGVAEAEVPDGLKTTIFRLLQEATSNVVRHSGGSALDIHLTAEEGVLCLAVVDDGVGFDPGSVGLQVNGRGHFGLGLSSMRERTGLSGGAFRLLSVPGGGTRVEACWRLDGAGLSG
jgi:signal transduction histidine kinase